MSTVDQFDNISPAFEKCVSVSCNVIAEVSSKMRTSASFSNEQRMHLRFNSSFQLLNPRRNVMFLKFLALPVIVCHIHGSGPLQLL